MYKAILFAGEKAALLFWLMIVLNHYYMWTMLLRVIDPLCPHEYYIFIYLLL